MSSPGPIGDVPNRTGGAAGDTAVPIQIIQMAADGITIPVREAL